jgi:hypothetical protein
LSAAESGEAFTDLLFDQGLEAGVHEGGFFPGAGQLGCAIEDLILDDERGPHAYIYAYFICMVKRAEKTRRDQKLGAELY